MSCVDHERFIGRAFRDRRSGMLWAIFPGEGFLPEQVVSLKQMMPQAPNADGRRRLAARWSMDLTREALQEYVNNAEWLGRAEAIAVACDQHGLCEHDAERFRAMEVVDG